MKTDNNLQATQQINLFLLSLSLSIHALLGRKGAWSPKSPKQQLESPGGEHGAGLLSPTLRRCCLEAPEDGSHEAGARRLSTSDSSKDSSLQSDTSLDSEDSCVSVIFVPRPGEAGPRLPADSARLSSGSEKSQRSTSNSSGSSDSPTGDYGSMRMYKLYKSYSYGHTQSQYIIRM